MNIMGKKDYLIVSPHLDDAMLSMGGFILANPQCRVLDLFNTAWSESSELQTLTPEEITRVNLCEEFNVMKHAGAEFVFENLPEILVRDPAAEWCTPLDKKRDAEIQEIVANVVAREIPFVKRIFLPMAIGEHVDHVIANELLEGLLETHGQQLAISVYEDLPYATYNDNENNYARRLKKFTEKFNATAELIDITGHIGKKIDILRIYLSQLNDDHLKRVHGYANDIGVQIGQPKSFYERVWNLNYVHN